MRTLRVVVGQVDVESPVAKCVDEDLLAMSAEMKCFASRQRNSKMTVSNSAPAVVSGSGGESDHQTNVRCTAVVARQTPGAEV